MCRPRPRSGEVAALSPGDSAARAGDVTTRVTASLDVPQPGKGVDAYLGLCSPSDVNVRQMNLIEDVRSFIAPSDGQLESQ